MAHRPKLVVSAKVLVYINGKLYGKCTSFSWSSNTKHRAIHSIDIPHPVELAPGQTDVAWQMSILRVIGDGGAQGAGIVAAQSDFTREKYFTLMLVERSTNLTIFQADYCVCDNEAWSGVAKDLLRGQLAGAGIIWGNEATK